MYIVFYKVQRTKYFSLDVIKIYFVRIVHSLGSGLPAKIIFSKILIQAQKTKNTWPGLRWGLLSPFPMQQKNGIFIED